MKPFAIAKPCNENWNDMRMDGGARHCGSCSKHVVDLSALTAAQVRGLLTLTGGHFCGRQQVRGDEIVLLPEPARARSPFALRAVIGGAIVATALGAAACQPARAAGPDPVQSVPTLVVAQVDPNPGQDPTPTPDPIIDEPERYMMGEMAAPLPTIEDDHIQFSAKSTKVSRLATAKLGEVASAIKTSPWMVAVLIEGNASKDETGPKSAGLALARAEAVKAALVKLGVEAKRLRTAARGKGARSVGFRICADLESCK